ncbi:PREDICTED: uncharacterized protein LOC105455005 [Wasmannia auropunctata]|uniref:uncharacterized protein LOC105455005 n=1 Tax=Wasmannia auropunctata TaxID=64793 RepID=UPI0005ED66E9|nr:PREDICTED: uncharacterized protein LOC105455005 [Wasmannia auropunctata]
MTRSHIVSAVFLIAVSASMIQGAVIPAQNFLHEQTFPNFVDLLSMPKFGELSHGVATSAAKALSSATSGAKTYIDTFRNGLSQHITVPSEYPVLHRFVHGEVWPNFADRVTGIVPGRVISPYPSSNYGGVNSGAASAAATSSAGSGGSARQIAI